MLLAATLACGAGGGATLTPTLFVLPDSGAPTVATLPPAPTSGDTGGAAGGATDGAIDACTLVTQQEVEAHFGVPAQPGVPTQVTTGTVTTCSCRYLSADNLNSLFVGAAWIEGGAANSIGWTALAGDSRPVTINGAQAMFGGDVLMVAKGNWMATLNGLLGGSIATAEQLTSLAQIVTDRLP
jgi:hypothetical protein